MAARNPDDGIPGSQVVSSTPTRALPLNVALSRTPSILVFVTLRRQRNVAGLRLLLTIGHTLVVVYHLPKLHKLRQFFEISPLMLGRC